jgi:hypothetical protein
MKKDTITLRGKLKSYSVLAGSVLAMGNVADAQIIYTNIPDTTFSAQGESGLAIDLNNDSISDFTIFLFKSSSGASVRNRVAGFASNVYNEIAATVAAPNYTYPVVIPQDDKIGPDLGWQPYVTSYFWAFGKFYTYGTGNPLKYGNWLGATDQFVGLRMGIDGLQHYGWLRMSVDSIAGTLTIKDYAYQTLPDSAIAAGDTGSIMIGIPNLNSLSDIKIIAYESHIIISSGLDTNDDIVISIIDMRGMILEKIITSEQEYSLTLDSLPQGIYLVSVQQGKKTKTIKVSLN